MFDPGFAGDGPAEDPFAEACPLMVTDENESGDDGDDLGDGLVFAEAFGGEDDVAGSGQEAEAGDGEFAGNDDHDHPGLDAADFDEGDEGGAGEDLVGERIHEDPEIGDEAA